ncbi:MAG: NifB/NifX family molybdenum-iron cluster-binding protein [Heliobacteriaceae bacterium]|nr:NifB/NifX family molybdenum-iron cluster-binding protein [Heliobacteriaceae bacterium]MDD4587127.1 NifB/NifX family molybdenum-iron cluster-binding protein [Heliobacteriaceae bacterium]
MHIAVTATGQSLDSPVDERFGRARYILIVDPESGLVEAVDNQANVNAAQGAGLNAAQIVVEWQAEWVLTGRVGPKAFAVLKEAGIKIGLEAGGLVRETVERFQAGEFKAS